MDSSGLVQARLAQMRDAAATIENSARRVADSIDHVESEIRQLGANRFSSEGAETFFRDYEQLTPQLREAGAYLLRFQEKLARAADEIEAAARAV